jgi:DNA-binding beta-propeller fold protein YncE
VKHGAVISARHNTVDLIRTMEAVLGTAPLGLNDAMAEPMAEVFDVHAAPDWRFEARVPAVLRSTKLPLPPGREACLARPTHDAAWWAAAMKGQDFSAEDRLDTAAYNRALWRGLRGNEPYPAARNGADLRAHRAEILAKTGHGDCG